jgi:serine/threonine-protein kinase RsbW
VKMDMLSIGGLGHKQTIYQSFCASDTATRQALTDLSQKLQEFGVDSDEVEKVETILAEVYNNIVEHAFSGVAPGVVRSRMTVVDAALKCLVADNGRPLPESGLPAGNLVGPATCRKDLPEGGFGWFLIRHLTRQLYHQRVGGTNYLEFVIPFEEPAKCPTALRVRTRLCD